MPCEKDSRKCPATFGLYIPPVPSTAVVGYGMTVIASGTVQFSESLAGLISAFQSKGSGGGTGGNTPTNNQTQNMDAKYAADKYNLSKIGRRELHDRISKQGYGKWEIIEEAEAIARLGGKYVK